MNHSPFIESSGSQLVTKPETHTAMLSVDEIRTQTRISLEKKLGIRENTDDENERINQTIQLLPNSIQLEAVDCSGIGFLTDMASSTSHSETVFEAIHKPLDLHHLQNIGYALLNELKNNLPNPVRLLELLPDTIDSSIPSDSFAWALVSVLIKLDLADQVWLRMPQPFPPFNHLGDGFLDILMEFQVVNMHKEEILTILPSLLTLETIQSSEHRFLCSIADSSGISEIISRLPKQINLSTLTIYAARVLVYIWKQNQQSAVTDRLPPMNNLNDLSDGAIWLFDTLGFPPCTFEHANKSRGFMSSVKHALNPRYGRYPAGILNMTTQVMKVKREQVTIVIPATINLETLSTFAAQYLLDFLTKDDVLARLPTNFHLSQLSSGGKYLLSTLFLSKRKLARENTLVENYLEVTHDTLRKPIDPSDLREINSKTGPYLSEIIDEFRIKKNSARVLKSGWYQAELRKGGSRSLVYINLDTESEKVVFRTRGYRKRSLETYQLALKLLPEYVTCQFYPELLEQPIDAAIPTINPKHKGSGFREVFAGASLGQYDGYTLPTSVRTSIDQQVLYIKLVLNAHGINHNHDHSWNYNVRFLLTSPDGNEKNISFDLNAAIQIAVERGWTLTPIVTLRDWDLSTVSLKRKLMPHAFPAIT